MGDRNNIFDMSKILPLLPRIVTDVSELWRVIYGSQGVIYGCLRLTTIWRSVRNRKKNPCMWTRYKANGQLRPEVVTGQHVCRRGRTSIIYNFADLHLVCGVAIPLFRHYVGSRSGTPRWESLLFIICIAKLRKTYKLCCRKTLRLFWDSLCALNDNRGCKQTMHSLSLGNSPRSMAEWM